jgi:hypothetical protein
VCDLLTRQRPVKHPRTVELSLDDGQRFFVKIFFPISLAGGFKDCFRRSKAVRALFAAADLREAGFHAPLPVGAGEERHCALLRRSFLVSVPLDGTTLPEILSKGERGSTPALALRRKREGLRQLARELRRFHDYGYVHGDLVPGNVFVQIDDAGAPLFCLMDNDRTRRYPRWLRQRLWRRNLVQLNRFPLPGISLQDRMRFFHAYVDRSRLGRNERRLLARLERHTRRRRRECDGVNASGSFRRLMQWTAATER